MSLWSKKEALDEGMFLVENLRVRMRVARMRQRFPQLFARAQATIEDLVTETGTEFSVIANGPSSAGVTPTTEDRIFVNFGFRHASFATAKRPILTVVDNKLADGGWSLDMLRDAKAANSAVTFALGALLLQSAEVRAFVETERCVLVSNYLGTTRYTNFARPFKPGALNYGGGATEQAIALAMSLGARSLDIYGFDGNNVVLGLAGQDTHFYGNDPLKDWTNPSFVARELRFLSYFIDRNQYFAKLIEAQGAKVVNHTPTPFMSGMWSS